jgi:hypothetical protein
MAGTTLALAPVDGQDPVAWGTQPTTARLFLRLGHLVH